MACRIFRFHDTAFLVTFNDSINRGNPVTFAVFANIVEGICQHHTLTQQLFRWFVRVHHACITHQFVEEAEVEQVHNGVFNTTNVDIHRQPVVSRFGIQHTFFVLRASVARIVPGGLHKGVESVGFTQCWHTVNGSFRPLRICFNRAGNAVHYHIFRQDHRQLVVRGRHYGTVFQRHHRNRRAPVTLTGNTPVAQAVVHFTLANAHRSQFIGDGVEGRFMVKTVELARVEQHAFFSQGLLRKIWLRAVSCQDNRFDIQAVFRGKLVVALVVTRNRHNCARAVFHQYEVCCPNGNFFAR